MGCYFHSQETILTDGNQNITAVHKWTAFVFEIEQSALNLVK